MMALFKIGRMVTALEAKDDNFIDAIGYLACAGEMNARCSAELERCSSEVRASAEAMPEEKPKVNMCDICNRVSCGWREVANPPVTVCSRFIPCETRGNTDKTGLTADDLAATQEKIDRWRRGEGVAAERAFLDAMQEEKKEKEVDLDGIAESVDESAPMHKDSVPHVCATCKVRLPGVRLPCPFDDDDDERGCKDCPNGIEEDTSDGIIYACRCNWVRAHYEKQNAECPMWVPRDEEEDE